METRTEVAPRITLSKANLASAAVCGNADSRPILSGLAVDHTGTTATDGHALVHIAHQGIEPANTEMPVMILDPQTVKALKGASPTVSSDGNGGVNAASMNGIAHYPLGVIEGTYPDWASVVPTEEPVIVLGLDLALLHRTLHALSAPTRNGAQVKATISIYGVKRPVKIETTAGEGQEAMAIVMPMNLKA